MRHETIPLERRDAWNAALDGIPHGFAHTWDSAHAMSLTTGRPVMLFVHHGVAGRAVCPFYERAFGDHHDIVTPFGFSGFVQDGETPGLEASWRAFVAARGYVAGYLGLHPLFSPEKLFAEERVVSNTVYVLDAMAPEETLLSRMSQNRRRDLARWRRSPPRLVDDPDRVSAFVCAHFRRCHRERGASDVYMFTDATLRALLESEHVFTVAAASAAGDIEAVSLFGVTPFEGQYLFNVSTEAGRGHATGLLWEARARLLERGVGPFDLGGGIRPDPGDGVAIFKARLGAVAHPLASLQQVYRPDVYDALCASAGVDPRERGYFPAFRRPVAE